MMGNEICLNTLDSGSIWGVMCDWVHLNQLTKQNRNVTFEYIGNYLTYDDDSVYAVFSARNKNYFVVID